MNARFGGIGAFVVLIWIAWMVSLMAAAGVEGGLPPEDGPATVVPADALAYAEMGKAASQEVVAMGALPPVAGMFMERAGVDTPFGFLDRVLGLPAGTADNTAPHVSALAAGFATDLPFLVIGFDGAQWPAGLLDDAPRDADGSVPVFNGNMRVVQVDRFLLLAAPAVCRQVASGDFASLARDSGFREARGAIGDPLAWAYVSTPRVLARVREEMRGNDARVLNAFLTSTGLERARYATVKLTGVPEPDALQVTLQFQGQDARVLQLISGEEMAVAHAVPAAGAADVLAHWSNGSAFLGGIRDILLDMDDQIGGGSLRRELARIEQRFGFALDDLFASIGSGAGAWLYSAEAGHLIGPSDWAVVVLLEDSATFGNCLNTMLGGPPAQATAHGLPVRRLGPVPAFYAVADDRLVVAGAPATIERYLDELADPARETLAGEGAPSGALYVRVDSGALLTSYPAPQSGAKVLIALGREGDALVLRAGVEDFDPVQAQRLAMHGYPAVMMAMLMPALGRARLEARKATGRANLHNIGLGLMMYSNDHDGNFPETLAELVDLGYLDSPDALQDPADPSPPLIPGTNTRCSYRYVGPAMRIAPAGVIVCYTRRGVYPEGRNCLNSDMAVVWATEGMLASDQGIRTSLRAGYEAFVFDTGGQLTAQEQIALREFYGIGD